MIKRQVFPYFGGKGRVAAEVWRRFGPVTGYLEPFGGSLAMALRNPHPEVLKSENLNDFSGFIANFWRSVQYSPEETARHADSPVTQVDLAARNQALADGLPDLLRLLMSSPTAHDPRMAGWWVWGISTWIGAGWATGGSTKRPHLGDHGMGVHSLGQRPHLGDHGMGGFYDLYTDIAHRLRFSRMTCCDWKSLKSTLHRSCKWGVFLDPPYTAASGRDPKLYSEASSTDHLSLGHEVAEWAIEIGCDHRVALCGILGEYEIPESWEVYTWKTSGMSYGGRNREEVIWFSPACLP